jgi:hypothetical protein
MTIWNFSIHNSTSGVAFPFSVQWPDHYICILHAVAHDGREAPQPMRRGRALQYSRIVTIWRRLTLTVGISRIWRRCEYWVYVQLEGMSVFLPIVWLEEMNLQLILKVNIHHFVYLLMYAYIYTVHVIQVYKMTWFLFRRVHNFINGSHQGTTIFLRL